MKLLKHRTIKGKSYAKSVKLGPELEEYLKDIANHERFQKLCDEIVEVNERICEMRPVRVAEDEDELVALKKIAADIRGEVRHH